MISKEGIPSFNPKFDVVSVFIEHDGNILLLRRQDHKPQGNTWSVPSGKVQRGEETIDALVREVVEETAIFLVKNKCSYHGSYQVRYPDFDYRFHIYHFLFENKPPITLNIKENKEYMWLPPKEALTLDLIQHEDDFIKLFYEL